MTAQEDKQEQQQIDIEAANARLAAMKLGADKEAQFPAGAERRTA